MFVELFHQFNIILRSEAAHSECQQGAVMAINWHKKDVRAAPALLRAGVC